jgi:hypothetical protein
MSWIVKQVRQHAGCNIKKNTERRYKNRGRNADIPHAPDVPQQYLMF